jgi:hypothetical protein
MSRTLAFTAALAACLAVALPASASGGRGVTGVLVAVSDSSVSVKHGRHIVTCRIGDHSPAVTGYSTGEWVQAFCRRMSGGLMLAKIHHLRPNTAGAGDSEPVRFGGTVTALTDASITLHDGDRDLTCKLDRASPSTVDLKVGQHAKITCVDGVLTAWSPVTTGDAARVWEGVVTATGSSITVHNAEHGDLTCSVGDGSPSLAAVKVGDRVLVGCRVGTNQLVYLKVLAPGSDGTPPAGDPTPTPPSTHTITGSGGVLTVLTAGSITVHNTEHGNDFTCTVGDGSPALGDYHVGDHVKVLCTDGRLTAIARIV